MLSSVLSIVLIPLLEPLLGPYISKYGDNVFGWVIFFILRIITVVSFQIKLGIIAILYHRSIGLYKSLLISILVFVIGGNINYFLGYKYNKKIYKIFMYFLAGRSCVKKYQKKSKKFVTKSQTRSILFYFAFSYVQMSYISGMQKTRIQKLPGQLNFRGYLHNQFDASRDLLVDKNNSIYLLLVIVPMFITWSITGGFLLQEKLNTK
ncbi:MAG: hypothetical protein HC932_06160 [Thermales bacterium]|nr:hypothetical protein [Thermales bacterium]